MKVVVNLLVEYKERTPTILDIVRSHPLMGKTRACRCNIPKTTKTERIEGLDLEVVNQSYNVCESGRRHLNRELERLGDWINGRATKLDNN